MSLALARRERYRRIANRARRIPGEHGLRPYTVSVSILSHTGTYPGEGTESASTTSIVEFNGQPPKVRQLNDEELALGGLPKGTWEIGPITPDYVGGGITWAVLTGSAATDGQQVHYILTGPEFPSGASFVRVGAASDRALHYTIQVAPLSSREP